MKFIGILIRKLISAPAKEDIVFKDTCKANRHGFSTRFDDLQKHMDNQFDLLKMFISKNGHK